MAKRTIKFYGKTSDCFSCNIYEDGKQLNVEEYDGYPPSFLGNDGIHLEIDLDTGQIQNWKKPSEEELREIIGDDCCWFSE